MKGELMKKGRKDREWVERKREGRRREEGEK